MKFILRFFGLKFFYEDEMNTYFFSVTSSMEYTIYVLSKQELFSIRQLSLSPTQIKLLMMYDLEGGYDVKTLLEFDLPVVTKTPVINVYMKGGWDLLTSHEGYMRNYTLAKTFGERVGLMRLVSMKEEILGTDLIFFDRKCAASLVEALFKKRFGRKSVEFDTYKKGEIEDGN